MVVNMTVNLRVVQTYGTFIGGLEAEFKDEPSSDLSLVTKPKLPFEETPSFALIWLPLLWTYEEESAELSLAAPKPSLCVTFCSLASANSS